MQRIFVHGRVESAGDASHLGQHFGKLQAQFIQFHLVLALPFGPPLLTVDMKAKP